MPAKHQGTNIKRLSLLACAALETLCPAYTHAQPYPAHPVRLIVGSSAGGGGDGVARVVAAKLSPVLSQQIVVDNRPGAAGNIGTELVARAAPDGYTLLFAYPGHVINPVLFKKLPFDPTRDFAAVGMIATNQLALVVNPALPVQSVKELIAYVKSRPGKLSMAALPGSTPHLAGELFKTQAGLDILFVPYKGNGPATNDVIAGQVEIMFNTLALVTPLVKAGRLRALATAGEKRSELMPELPTISEAGLKGFSCSGWYGLLVPAGTPRGVVATLNHALNGVLRDADMQSRMRAMGNEVAPGTPEAFDAFVRAEIPKWGDIARRAGIKQE
ncbi:MAG TPA: tripartite tricarboxylate transporter substrate binding protein [Burkholderiales bacterium]|nr:tripartite tricarboxylate transporter substrate binding protein [Burkholderiales bacterium]